MPNEPAPTPEQPEQSAELRPRPPGEPAKLVELRAMIETKLGDMADYVSDAAGSYILGVQSARIFVVPTWVDEGPTVIRVFAITNLDVPISPELTAYLLETNLGFVFGAFALDTGRGAVWFNHNLLGDFTDPAELEATIAAVAQTADEYDDVIKERFGGRLYVEAPAIPSPQPPTPGYL